MIREITRNEVKKLISKDVMILYGESLYSIEEMCDSFNVRFLVDEEPESEPEPKPERKTPSTRQSKNEQKVLAAWNNGEKTIKQVQEETGLSYATVRKYIPLNADG